MAVEAARAIGRRLGAEESYEVVDLAAIASHLLAPGPYPDVEVALELVAEASVPTPGLAVLEPELPRLEEVPAAWADRVAPQAAAAPGQVFTGS